MFRLLFVRVVDSSENLLTMIVIDVYGEGCDSVVDDRIYKTFCEAVACLNKERRDCEDTSPQHDFQGFRVVGPMFRNTKRLLIQNV